MKSKRLFLVLFALGLIGFGGYLMLDYWLDNKAQESMASLKRENVLLNDATWDSVDVDAVNRTLTLSGVRYKTPWGGSLLAQKLVVERFDGDSDIPTFGEVSFAGLRVDAKDNLDSEDAESLRQMGYETVSCDGRAGFEWDPGTNELKVFLKPVNVSEAGSGTLHLHMSGADLRNWKTGLFLGLSMKQGRLVWDDDGLRKRWLRAEAMKQDLPASLLAATYNGNLKRLGRAFRAEGNGRAAEAADRLGDWVEHGGQLEITFDPENPLPYLYLFMGQSLGDLLELSRVAVSVR